MKKILIAILILSFLAVACGPGREVAAPRTLLSAKYHPGGFSRHPGWEVEMEDGSRYFIDGGCPHGIRVGESYAVYNRWGYLYLRVVMVGKEEK